MHSRLKVLEAYKRAVSTWGKWVDKHVNNGRTRVIFRGYSGVHFRYGSIYPFFKPACNNQPYLHGILTLLKSS